LGAEPGHYDLAVVLAFIIAITIAGFSFMFWIAWKIHKESKETFALVDRRSRVLGSLIVQESEKIRALMADD
jgi:threonine/homoserine/homoserine lactone efflux protein